MRERVSGREGVEGSVWKRVNGRECAEESGEEVAKRWLSLLLVVLLLMLYLHYYYEYDTFITPINMILKLLL